MARRVAVCRKRANARHECDVAVEARELPCRDVRLEQTGAKPKPVLVAARGLGVEIEIHLTLRCTKYRVRKRALRPRREAANVIRTHMRNQHVIDLLRLI